MNLLDQKYVNRDGDSMTGPLELEGDVRQDKHAATKRYVDTVLANLASQVVRRDGTLPMTGLLTLSGAPTAGQHAATKAYTDALAAAAAALMVRLDGAVPMTGLLTLSGAPVNPLHASTKAYVDALRAYVDTQDLLMLLLDGTRPMTGLLTLSGAPVNALHASTRGYVDTLRADMVAQDLLMVLLDGTRPMTGALTLPGLPVNPLHAATKSYVDALPMGLSTYDAVVAAASGDYTSIVTACATEAAGARIYIKSGTYSETANIVMKDGQMLIGENPEDTIIDFGAANRKITWVGACTNLAVMNLTVQNSIADFTIQLTGDYALVRNCRIIGSVNATVGVSFLGTHCWLDRNYITDFTKLNQQSAWVGNYTRVTGNTFNNGSIGLRTGTDCLIVGNIFLTMAAVQAYLAQRSNVQSNLFRGGTPLRVFGHEVTISGNYINGATGIIWNGNFDYIAIIGNIFDGSQVDCADVGVSDCTISGNIFKGGAGVDFAGFNSTISGNVLQGTAFINLAASAHDMCIVGNNLQASTAVPVILDAGTANTAKNNHGVSSLMEKMFLRMRNTSGGGLVAGDTVVFQAVAVGDQFTTTVIQGDDMVYGMVEDANIAHTAYGNIQTEGFTVKLKCNGTVAILVGDFLCTTNVAGIAKKAAAADMAFAIALEAYAGADSNGVIDALLVKPRKL